MSEHVVVIGGGYAGVMAANRVAGSGGSGAVVTTLVTAEEAFVERIRLHEFAAGSSATATVTFASVLHPAVRLRVSRVDLIDAGERLLTLSDGSLLPYDHLVLAAGSSGRIPAGDGVHSLADLQSAARLRAALADLPSGAAVAVVGGGLTGLEAVSEIAERHPSLTVRLHTAGAIAPSVSAASRARLRRRLVRLGIELREGLTVPAGSDLRAELDAELVVWCAGFAAPALAGDSGLPTAPDGRLRVGPTLAVVGGDGRVFGAGDAVVIDDPRYGYQRMSCASALPMGAHAADNVLRRIAGEALRPLSSGFVAQCLSLGRRDALVQGVTSDDRPRRVALSGRAAGVVKEMICRQTLRWLRGEVRRSGSYSWPSGPVSTAPMAMEEAAWN
ncbi:NADH dehydrogenase FAD-containing subunit [Curtobacterium sp. PhB130]|uniref:NAD(P)/FAD-dependent oxidoreductase n=1 Tax=Curtobacterium sp. PhB130 TaxID=2485178 RepID=UPI000F9AE890|nr:FAD-dependent oxidoreductase [Curtobacterium sp. PhB130]ROS71927.1 NADH dehydrogenase FAD-containing subunit [Curtobacterium sp. PhB130]